MNVAVEKAREAALLRLWSHTVGIVNNVPLTGADPETGQPADGPAGTGTGVAGVWGKHHFILTAKHVLKGAQAGDLSFFCMPDGGLKYQAPSDVRLQDTVAALPLSTQQGVIHRCEWEDLAVMTTTPEAIGRNVQFADMAKFWIDPPEGKMVHGIGFPIDYRVRVETKVVGTNTQKTDALYPRLFNGAVMPCPGEKDLKFKYPSFDRRRHYLIPYEDAKQGFHPRGISGAAMWVESNEKQRVWNANFRLAGISTMCYEKGKVEQIVKASMLRKFLRETLGDPKPKRGATETRLRRIATSRRLPAKSKARVKAKRGSRLVP